MKQDHMNIHILKLFKRLMRYRMMKERSRLNLTQLGSLLI